MSPLVELAVLGEVQIVEPVGRYNVGNSPDSRDVIDQITLWVAR